MDVIFSIFNFVEKKSKSLVDRGGFEPTPRKTACLGLFTHDNARSNCRSWPKLDLNFLRQPGIEPGSIAWEATMLTITPLTQRDIMLHDDVAFFNRRTFKKMHVDFVIFMIIQPLHKCHFATASVV